MNGLNATSPLVVGEEVRSALDDGAAVVALESNVGSTPEAAAAARAAEDGAKCRRVCYVHPSCRRIWSLT